jgi:SET domain-containing protein
VPLASGMRFVDPCVKYKAEDVPPHLQGTEFYIKVFGGGYYEVASLGQEGADNAWKSTTFYLNEARESNRLPAARTPNVAYSEWRGPSGQSLSRRFELLVLRDIEAGAELVVRYTRTLQAMRPLQWEEGHAPQEEVKAAMNCRKVANV